MSLKGLGIAELFSDKEAEAFGYWLKHEGFLVHLELDSLESRLGAGAAGA